MFLNVGCNNAEDLLGMSMWRPARISEFLGRLPPNDDGECLSEMEKAHLTNHFLEYFQTI